MRSLSAFGLALLLVASAPPADAQLGRIVDRARDAVSGAAPPAARPTGPAPAFDLAPLLDTTFDPDRSEFRFAEPHDYVVLFAPADYDGGEVSGSYVVRSADGQVVIEKRMWGGSVTGVPSIVTVQAGGGSGVLDASGAYTFEVVFEGETVAAIPFTAEVSGGDDPFDPRPVTQLDGPWRTHGFFEHELEEADGEMTFSTWIRRDEPEGQGATEVSVRREGREVAFGAGSAGGSYNGWVRVSYRLLTAASRDRDGRFARHANDTHPWTIGDVTPGPYEVVLSTESGPVRTFAIEGAAGAFVAHPRSDVLIQPRSQFLTPRRMSGQMYRTPMQVWWVGPEQM